MVVGHVLKPKDAFGSTQLDLYSDDTYLYHEITTTYSNNNRTTHSNNQPRINFMLFQINDRIYDRIISQLSQNFIKSKVQSIITEDQIIQLQLRKIKQQIIKKNQNIQTQPTNRNYKIQRQSINKKQLITNNERIEHNLNTSTKMLYSFYNYFKASKHK